MCKNWQLRLFSISQILYAIVTHLTVYKYLKIGGTTLKNSFPTQKNPKWCTLVTNQGIFCSSWVKKLRAFYWLGISLLFCVADCWQQLLACSLHGAHIPPDYGFLQPVHLYEWPESGGWRPGTGDTAAGGWAAGGKNNLSPHYLTWKWSRIWSWDI